MHSAFGIRADEILSFDKRVEAILDFKNCACASLAFGMNTCGLTFDNHECGRRFAAGVPWAFAISACLDLPICMIFCLFTFANSHCAGVVLS